MRYLFLFLAATLFMSCSKNLTPFNQDLYDKYRWSDSELKSIQFYLSDDIVLVKKQDNSEASIDNGSINIKKEKSGEKVIIRKGTPGTFLFSPKNNRFAISFDESSQQKYLIFGPNQTINGKYALLAKEWDKYNGTVTYNGDQYSVSARDAYSVLMVDINRYTDYKYKNTFEKGSKINY